jgi:Mg2+-importing ATPase
MANFKDIKDLKSKQTNNRQKLFNLKPQLYDFDPSESTTETFFSRLETSEKGLTDKEAKSRLHEYGYNEPARKKQLGIAAQILTKFISPLNIVLIIIGGFSLFFGETISAVLVLSMIVLSVFLSYIQEYRSGREVEKLMEMVKTTTTVYRNGKPKEVNIREIVPGDVVDLFAGDMIPADLRIITCKDLFVNQATLTGESMPIEKTSKAMDKKPGSISEMTNLAFMGSSVVSGTGLGLVIKTGLYTQFGELSKRLAGMTVESSFDKGVNKFTWAMIQVMVVMVIVIFCINWGLKKNLIEAIMFSLAVAVGLTPEMMPLIITINLSKGAIQMAKKKVIVKRLNSIQNFGAMDILCTDKTGTITMDKVVLEKYCDCLSQENKDVLRHACLNSYYQTGLKNILDRAVLKYVNKQEGFDITSFKKIDELPFDFSRRIMSVVVDMEGKTTLISKGAPEEIFKRCTKYELDGEILDMEYLILADLKEEYERLSSDGFRVLALAYRNFTDKNSGFTRDDESELILKGYVAFLDPPKASAEKAIKMLKIYGVAVKILTGDNELVTRKICGDVGLDVKGLLNGDAVEKMDDAALAAAVEHTTVFARLSPVQKERIIHALHSNKHIVGYMGDGINDALALKASDVGISVNNAVDIAKESADIILLEKKLNVLEDGVIEGRKTFGNITKYIKMASSSNFGNMLSMTGASLFLPFLPMTPIQILFNNFLYDISQTSIPTDEVDEEYIKAPRPWNVKSIRKYMFFIGPVSSLFDFMTFAVMLFVFHCTGATQNLFHTGWFIESLVSQTLVIYVIRTGKVPITQSSPSKYLVFTSLAIIGLSMLVPFTPLAEWLGFVRPPAKYFLILEAMMTAYMILVYFVQQWFIKKFGAD